MADTNLHSAVTALAEKENAISDAIAEFYQTLERQRCSQSADILSMAAMRKAVGKSKKGRIETMATPNTLNDNLQRSYSIQTDNKRVSVGSTGSRMSCATSSSPRMAVANTISTKRDHAKLLFSQYDALIDGEIKMALEEAMLQLAALEERILPTLESSISQARSEAMRLADKTLNTIAAKVREAEDEEGTVDAAIWESEMVLELLTAQATTMKSVIERRNVITDTGLEEVLAQEMQANAVRERAATDAANAELKRNHW